MSAKIIGRVVVGVGGSPGSLEALRFALGQAWLLGATLMPVLAWQAPGEDLASRRVMPPDYLRELRDGAEKHLIAAFEEGLGGLPADADAEPWVIREPAGRAPVETASRTNDLLVVGAGRRGKLRHALHSGTARYCLANAVCPVIAVPPPLQAQIPSLLMRRHSTNRLLEDLMHLS